MKKLVMVVIVFAIVTFFVIEDKNLAKQKKAVPTSLQTNDERRSVFISYIELSEFIKDQDVATGKKNIMKALDNLKNNNFNMVIVHVSPFSDTIYPSQIFPYSKYIASEEGKDPGFDILEYFIDEAHKRDIEFHAWINPYRISNTTDTNALANSNPALRYLESGDAKIIPNKGIYYNPASSKVVELIISLIEEIVVNYDVDGIHFDDYFYPDDTIDLENYQAYLNEGGLLNLSDYRLNNVTSLIKAAHDKIKSIKPNVAFGVSPEGNINNNYESNYIDTKKILSEKGYIDYIMPQVYFGFANEIMPFIETVNMWNQLIQVDDIKLIPALAFYKAGTQDDYALSGANEWLENDDIIKKQILTIRNLSHYDGFSIFRYDYMFNDDYHNKNTVLRDEFNNLLEVIK